MGVVFLAEHQRIARRVAIKVLTPERTQKQDAVKRFFHEARATSLIHHPGIVEVFDCDVDPHGRAYIVMEYLEGETLAARLQRDTSLSWQTACVVAKQIATAVEAAHRSRIVHRDLKSENVFLLSDGNDQYSTSVKVLDFGIAKLSGETLSGFGTLPGTLLGTPEYMSPEQCGGGGPVDHRTDIYSLGCLLFEMIRGQTPFATPGIRELIAAHLFHSPPSLLEAAPATPPWLDDLIRRMLSKEPAKRPQSMLDVARALDQAQEVRATNAPVTAAASLSVAESSPSSVAEAPSSATPAPFGRRSVQVGAALVAVIGAGGIWAAAVGARGSGAHSGSRMSAEAPRESLPSKQVRPPAAGAPTAPMKEPHGCANPGGCQDPALAASPSQMQASTSMRPPAPRMEPRTRLSAPHGDLPATPGRQPARRRNGAKAKVDMDGIVDL
jgi:serine/threonine-protein kinase